MAGMEWRRYELTDELAASIASLAPVLESTERQAEIDRRLPAEAVDALKSIDLFRTGVPAVAGGLEASAVLEFEVYEAVARMSSPAGWTTFIGSFHTGWVLAHIGDPAFEAMVNAPEPPIVAGQLAPFGRGVVVDGGIRVTGKYSWGSGINHATWVMGGMLVGEPEPGPPHMFVWVAPKADVKVLDNWDVSGLAGSGSMDYAVEDVFVPDGFWFSALAENVPRGGAHYGAPLLLQVVPAHSGFALGAAERALGLIADVAAAKRRQHSSSTVADRGAFQRDLGLAYHRLSAARSYIVDLLRELGGVDWSDRELLDELATRYVGAVTYVTEVGVETAALAYKYAGGSAARLDSPFQRVLRDLQVAQQHTAVADTSYDGMGRWLIDEAARLRAVKDPSKESV